jgi:alkylation response protein AidB-like acyl-CoA dehydrogenase
MNETPLPTALQKKSAQIAASILAPNADRVDRGAQWPADGLHALADAGLMGLHIPHRLGGLGEGLMPLAIVTEELARACSSTAMCFGMHCVASKVLAAKATKYQEEHYLRPIAQGRHITTLALSEPGTGSHFFLPRSRYWVQGDHFVLDGQKSFVTSGRHADSYVVSAVPPGAELDPGTFTCLVMDADSPGVEWLEAWHGLGMRGNSSRAVKLNNVAIPRANLLGMTGDQIWYVFEIVTPYFLVAMAGVYVGIAQAALDLTIARLQIRRHEHTGETLSTVAALADEVADMWTRTERARQLVHYAARLGDAGSPNTQAALFAAKLEVAGTAVAVTNAAMRLAGGRGYQENSAVARLLRDAQAAHVMSPTTHLLKQWLGRSILGLPLL